LSHGFPRILAAIARPASIHQEIADRIADCQWADRNCDLEEPGPQPCGATLHRSCSRGRKTARPSQEAVSCWRAAESAPGTELPIWDVCFHGESRRVTRPAVGDERRLGAGEKGSYDYGLSSCR